MNNQTAFLRNALKGAAMGIAEVIPGVSGGTIAFITGIYEQLLNSIKAFGPGLVRDFREGGIAQVWQRINGPFLVSLLAGMALGIVVGVFTIAHLLENYPPLVWGFFFGLIIASAIYIGRQIGTWNVGTGAALLIGAVVAYGITVITPANGSESLLFVFFCGAIAISALILPGISGSFILLLLGMYTYIVTDTLKPALKTLDPEKLVTVGVFALGCLTGLMTLSRFLSWTFKHYRDLTLALLTGFMIGSLNKIWPWRNPTDWLRDDNGQILMKEDGLTPKKILMEANVFPGQYDGEPSAIGVLVLMLLGFALVFLLERLDRSKML
ncbi:MAG: DUF368 domain-containing protein, partial [Bacteroidota bacterium]